MNLIFLILVVVGIINTSISSPITSIINRTPSIASATQTSITPHIQQHLTPHVQQHLIPHVQTNIHLPRLVTSDIKPNIHLHALIRSSSVSAPDLVPAAVSTVPASVSTVSVPVSVPASVSTVPASVSTVPASVSTVPASVSTVSNILNEQNAEVYFMSPKVGNHYFHAESTVIDKKVGYHEDWKYYAPKNKLKDMGKYTHMKRWGWGDGGGGSYHFIKDDVEDHITASYEGRTCFLEYTLFDQGLVIIEEHPQLYDVQSIIDLKEFLG